VHAQRKGLSAIRRQNDGIEALALRESLCAHIHGLQEAQATPIPSYNFAHAKEDDSVKYPAHPIILSA
jgi:hypothetical protein